MSEYKNFELECIDMWDKLEVNNSTKVTLIKYIEWRLQREREIHETTTRGNEEGLNTKEPTQLKFSID